MDARRRTWLILTTVGALAAVLLVPTAASGGVDGDGDLDVVFANVDGADSQVCLGDGSGDFVCSDVDIDFGPGARSVEVGHLDGDGELDLVFGVAGGSNKVCLGEESGPFLCGPIDALEDDTSVMDLGDVNNDGNLDVVFANFGRNRVCMGDGFGSFACNDVSAHDVGSSSVALGDMDDDGNLDAVFADSGGGGTLNSICLGDGAGGFACSEFSVSDNSLDVEIADMNNDGNLDAVFSRDLCLGDGSGGFVCHALVSGTADTRRIDVGDVNGDSKRDVVLANEGGRNRVCLGDGSGGFDCNDVSSDTNGTWDVKLGDVDRDGNLDAVFANFLSPTGQRNRVCLGDGKGGFSCSDVSADIVVSHGLAITPSGVERLAGSNRFATAAAISGSEFDPGVPAAYVATGGNFPDALAGGPVAALNGGPILLLSSIPGATAAELTRLQPQKIVILGGTGVVSAVDAAALAAFTAGPVERLSGANRFATAAAISASEFSPGVPVAYVATGANFPDALAGGPVAALNGGPILLVNSDSIPAATALELVRLQAQKIVILGGTGVVSNTVATQLGFLTAGAVERLAGGNRFATAAAISASQFSPGVDVAYVATGANFPDALAGGPVAGINSGPILLVNQNSIPGATATELTRLAPKKIVILGGTGVVSIAVETQLAAFIS